MTPVYALAQDRKGPYRLGYDGENGREYLLFARREGLPQDELPEAALPSLMVAMQKRVIVEAHRRDDGKVIYGDLPEMVAAGAEKPKRKGR
jgi:hypothetical protein